MSGYIICIKFAAGNVQTCYMQDYKGMAMPVLLDLLTRHTEIYTRLLAEKNFTAQFERSKFIIKHLQEEINERRTAGKAL